jgi:hypothetical protein
MLSMSSVDKNLVIGVTIAAVVIFAASFMPWGQVRGTATVNLPFLPKGADAPDLFGGMEFVATVTGWNGNMNVGRLELPNWLVVVAAIGVAILCWLKATSVWSAPLALLFGLAGYGLLHSADIMVWLLTSEKRSAGVGSFLTVVSFVGMLVALVRHARVAKPAAFADQPLG